jgi:hypothetical protein
LLVGIKDCERIAKNEIKENEKQFAELSANAQVGKQGHIRSVTGWCVRKVLESLFKRVKLAHDRLEKQQSSALEDDLQDALDLFEMAVKVLAAESKHQEWLAKIEKYRNDVSSSDEENGDSMQAATRQR